MLANEMKLKLSLCTIACANHITSGFLHIFFSYQFDYRVALTSVEFKAWFVFYGIFIFFRCFNVVLWLFNTYCIDKHRFGSSRIKNQHMVYIDRQIGRHGSALRDSFKGRHRCVLHENQQVDINNIWPLLECLPLYQEYICSNPQRPVRNINI